MNATFRLIALSAALAAGAASAQEATLFPGDPGYAALHPVPTVVAADAVLGRVTVIGSRSALREQVVADLRQAISNGSFDRSGEARPFRVEPWNSTMTRAEVLAEVRRARAEGTLDTSGEYWHGHDRLASAPGAERCSVASLR